MSDVLTIDVLKKVLPAKYKSGISTELLTTINQTLADPDLYEIYRDNFISYLSVLNDGKFKMTDYLNAVKYVTHKLKGDSNIDAYIKTFPDRYNSMLNRNLSAKDISSFVSIYNKSKLVNLILEQSMIPSWVINQDLYQKAINVQVELMTTANSEKVRSDAANSLLNHLKPPEVKKMELDIGVKANKEVAELKNLIVQLAGKQKQLIDMGAVTTREVANTQIIETSYQEVADD